jgi:hypothetical protein
VLGVVRAGQTWAEREPGSAKAPRHGGLGLLGSVCIAAGTGACRFFREVIREPRVRMPLRACSRCWGNWGNWGNVPGGLGTGGGYRWRLAWCLSFCGWRSWRPGGCRFSAGRDRCAFPRCWGGGCWASRSPLRHRRARSSVCGRCSPALSEVCWRSKSALPPGVSQPSRSPLLPLPIPDAHATAGN